MSDVALPKTDQQPAPDFSQNLNFNQPKEEPKIEPLPPPPPPPTPEQIKERFGAKTGFSIDFARQMLDHKFSAASLTFANPAGNDAAKIMTGYQAQQATQTNEGATANNQSVVIPGADEAIAYAQNPRPNPDNPQNGGNWGLWCLGLVNHAYQETKQTIPELGKENAYQSYLAFANQGLIHKDDSIPPKGAIVFFDYTTKNGERLGHVGISTGDGNYVGTTETGHPPTVTRQINKGSYLGWAYPDASKVSAGTNTGAPPKVPADTPEAQIADKINNLADKSLARWLTEQPGSPVYKGGAPTDQPDQAVYFKNFGADKNRPDAQIYTYPQKKQDGTTEWRTFEVVGSFAHAYGEMEPGKAGTNSSLGLPTSGRETRPNLYDGKPFQKFQNGTLVEVEPGKIQRYDNDNHSVGETYIDPKPVDLTPQSKVSGKDMTADDIRTVIANAEKAGGFDSPLNDGDMPEFIVKTSQETGVPVWLLLAQAQNETSFGRGMGPSSVNNATVRDGMQFEDGTVGNAHNIFNIRPGSGWNGKVLNLGADSGRFRAYDSFKDSVRDYANLLSSDLYKGKNLKDLVYSYYPPTDGNNVPENYINNIISFAKQNGIAIDRNTIPVTDQINGSDTSNSLGSISVKTFKANNVGTPTEKLSAALTSYEEAKKKLEKPNEKLAADLAKFDGVLTPEQKQKYITEYRKKYADDYKAIDDAGKNLVDVLNENRDALIAQAAKDSGTANKVFDAVKAAAATASGTRSVDYIDGEGNIASPSDADKLVQFTEGFLKSQSSKGFFTKEKVQELQQQVGKPLIQRLTAGLLAESNGDSEVFIQKLKTSLEPYGSFKDMALGLQETGFGTKAFPELLKSLKEAASLNKPISEIAADWKGRGFGGQVAVGISLALNAIAAGGTDGKEDLASLLKSDSQTIKDGLTIFSGITSKLIGDGGELAKAGKLALSARFAAGLVPYVGLVANTAALIAHGKSLDDPDAGLAISILGDCVAITAGVIQLVPVVGELAAPIGAIGEAISGFGELVSFFLKGDEARLRQYDILKKIGVDEGAIGILSAANIDQNKIKTLASQMHLSPDQIAEVAQKYPTLILELRGNDLGKLGELSDAMGLKGQNFVDFLSTISGDFPNPNGAVNEFIQAINGTLQGEGSSYGAYFQSNKPLTGNEWRTRLNLYADAMDKIAKRYENDPSSKSYAQIFTDRAKIMRLAASFIKEVKPTRGPY